MHDPRIDQLARQLVRYSTNLKRGEKVLVDLYDVPEEVGIALVREARGRGAIPFVTVNSLRVSRELLRGATDEQYRLLAKHRMAEMREVRSEVTHRNGGRGWRPGGVLGGCEVNFGTEFHMTLWSGQRQI